MGHLALAAKITHVPSMYLSELDGPRKGTRQRRHRRPPRDRPPLPRAGRGHPRRVRHALARQRELPRQLRAALPGHLHQQRAAALHQQHGLRDPGQPGARPAAGPGVQRAWRGDAGARRHHAGARVRHAGADALHERRPALQGGLGVGAVHGALPERQRAPGLGDAQAVEDHYDGTVAFLASGSLRHRFAQNGLAPEFAFKIWSPFLRDGWTEQVVEMWQHGEWGDFCAMLPEYAAKGHGEGFMHDTAMLLGALGWSDYDGRAEVVTPYFGASGTGQINAVFPVTPQDGRAVPPPQASALGRLPEFRAGPFTPLTPCRTSSSSTPGSSTTRPTCPACAAPWPTPCCRCATRPAPRCSRSAARACWPTRRRTMRWPTAAATTPSCT